MFKIKIPSRIFFAPGLVALLILGGGFFYTQRPRLNMIFISIDTLGADRISLLAGKAQGLTPNIDKFLNENLSFTRAFANATWTLPSHMSMFTGLLLRKHKVNLMMYPPYFERNKVDFDSNHWARGTKVLASHHKTLAEYLSEEGYSTHWFAHSRDWYFDLSLGFYRGFSKINPMGFDNEVGTQKIINWIESNEKTPFFAFIHTKSPHDPYLVMGMEWKDKLKISTLRPSKEKISKEDAIELVEKRFKTQVDLYSRLLTNAIWSDLCYIKKGSLKALKTLSESDLSFIYCHEIGTLTDIGQFEYFHNANVRFADEKFGEIIAALKSSGLYDNTVVILTSDHGEAFGRHRNLIGHGNSLYNEVLHVPLGIHVPGVPRRKIDELVQSVDLMPTLLDVLNIPLRTKVDGRSLKPLWTSERPLNKRGHIVSEGYDDRGAVITALQTDQWKLIYEDAGRVELYNLKDDPFELNEISEDNPDILEEMKLKLLAEIIK